MFACVRVCMSAPFPPLSVRPFIHPTLERAGMEMKVVERGRKGSNSRFCISFLFYNFTNNL